MNIHVYMLIPVSISIKTIVNLLVFLFRSFVYFRECFFLLLSHEFLLLKYFFIIYFFSSIQSVSLLFVYSYDC